MTELPAVYAPLYSAIVAAITYTLVLFNTWLKFPTQLRAIGALKKREGEVVPDPKPDHLNLNILGIWSVLVLAMYEMLVGQTQYVALLCISQIAGILGSSLAKYLHKRRSSLRLVGILLIMPIGFIAGILAMFGPVAGLIAYYL